RVVRPGGVVANIGVHGAPTTLHLEDLWIKNVTITTGLVDGTTVPMLLQLVRSGKIAAGLFGTHDFALHDMMAAYDTFAEAGKHNALKVVIRKQRRRGNEQGALLGPGDTDQVALGIGEVANHEARRGPGGPHPACPAQALGLTERRLHIGDADVEDHMAVVARSPADAAR